MDLELRPLNVLIGANGAGKSNLVSFFKMLNEMMAGRLQQFIGTTGRAQSLLHFGPKVTPEISARLEIQEDARFGIPGIIYYYSMRLTHAAGDTLNLAEETLVSPSYLTSTALGLGAGQETRLNETNSSDFPPFQEAAKIIRNLLDRCRVYHFHDTSPTARILHYCYVADNRSLMLDAGNLAAVLLRLRDENSGAAYKRIV